MYVNTIRKKRFISKFFIYLVLLAATTLCLFPFLWIIATAFKSTNEIYSMPPTFFAKKLQFENFRAGWNGADFSRYFGNSLFVTLSATIGCVISSSLVAYGFSRFHSRYSTFLFTVLLGTLMLPTQVTMIPQYLLFNKVHMIDTYWPLIIPSWLGGGAFNIFLFIQFYNTMPREMDEAAEIEGASSLQIYIKILLPLVKSVTLAVLVMSLVYHWNDFFNPLIYLNNSDKFTIAVGLQFFQSAQGTIQMGQMMAMSLVSLLPVLAIFAFCQKYFVEGIKLSGLKG